MVITGGGVRESRYAHPLFLFVAFMMQGFASATSVPAGGWRPLLFLLACLMVQGEVDDDSSLAIR
jgi:hypothetical protein